MCARVFVGSVDRCSHSTGVERPLRPVLKHIFWLCIIVAVHARALSVLLLLLLMGGERGRVNVPLPLRCGGMARCLS